jgi:hypothetical protein
VMSFPVGRQAEHKPTFYYKVTRVPTAHVATSQNLISNQPPQAHVVSQ